MSFWRRTPQFLSRRRDRAPSAPTNPALISDEPTPLDAGAPAAPVTLAIIGGGERGRAYAAFALQHPKRCRVVAVAEPRPHARARFVFAHQLEQGAAYATWQDLRDAGRRLADAVVVAVQDRMHAEVTQAFAEMGYDVLCEKPMATSVGDCLRMHDAVAKAGVVFGMGHVFRYSPYNLGITRILRSGALGQLINAVHIEPVGYYHFAHSYVRGNWRREDESSFSLMTKSCHDFDILMHWFAPQTPARVSSFGSLQHFRKSAKPAAAGGAARCLDCSFERECPYSAKRLYLDSVSRGDRGWPVSALVDDIPDMENITEALRTGPYGRCVYESDNDVCDNQVVNIEYDNGATASFTMVAHTSLVCQRQTRLHFSHGELVGDGSMYTVTDFRTRKTTRHVPRSEGEGHGGGDNGLMDAFISAVATQDQALLGTDVGEVLRTHMAVFAAERSRRERKVVEIAKFEKDERALVRA